MDEQRELRVLYVRDVAALRRVSLSAARTWLAGLQARGEPVQRVGNRLCITQGAYEALLTGRSPAPNLAREVAQLRREVQRLASRVRGLEGARRKGRIATIDVD